MASKTINVYYEKLEDVQPKILSQLKKLNKGFNGRMKYNLQDYFNKNTNDLDLLRIPSAKVYYVKGKKDQVKAWAMVYGLRYTYDRKATTTVDFYTKRTFRGQGYASAIASIIKSDYRNKKVCGATYCSSIFKRHGFKPD